MSISLSAIGATSSATSQSNDTRASQVAARMIKQMDADGNGTLDKKEYVTGMTARGVSADAASKQFDAIDTKKTGSITQSDLETAVKAGKLRPAATESKSTSSGTQHVKAATGGGGAAAKTYAAADANEDGTVTTEEQAAYDLAEKARLLATTGLAAQTTSGLAGTGQSTASKLGQVLNATA